MACHSNVKASPNLSFINKNYYINFNNTKMIPAKYQILIPTKRIFVPGKRKFRSYVQGLYGK